MIDKFHLLKYGLAVVLMFVGLKMVWLNDAFGGKFPISWSLGIITGVISLSVVLSHFPGGRESRCGSKSKRTFGGGITMKHTIEFFRNAIENNGSLEKDERALLFLIPLVQVAWAHGGVSPREALCIFEAAREDGIDAAALVQ